jgi:hypothetical protein
MEAASPARGELEARLRRLEDRAELRELTARYTLAIDDRDYQTLARLYASNAVYEGPFGRAEGRRQVVDYVASRMDLYGPTVHTPHSQVLEFDEDPDRASGIVTSHVEMSMGGKSVLGAARYYDEYSREEGSWRFFRRDLKFTYVMPWEDASTSLTAELRKRWPGSDPAAAELPENLG